MVRGQSLSGSLLWRVLVGVIFVPVLLYLAYFGGLPFFLAISVILLLALSELLAMMKAAQIPQYRATGLVLAVGVLLWAFLRGPLDWPAVSFLLLVLVFARGLLDATTPAAFQRTAGTFVAVWYVMWMGSHLILLREQPHLSGAPGDAGRFYVFLALITTWSYDTAAYAFGRLFGRRKLVPVLSPHKTVEGLVGGIIGAVAASLLVVRFSPGHLRLMHTIEIGLLVAVSATLGDLVESFLKRVCDKKDSSHIIPGHGGVLDRFDSMLFSAPAIYYFLELVVW